MTEEAVNDNGNLSWGFSDLKQGLKDILAEYVTLTNRSSLTYQMFRIKMQDTAIRRVEILLVLTGLLAVAFWPQDFLLQKSAAKLQFFAYWRIYMFVASIVPVIALESWAFFRENLNVFYVSVLTLNMSVAGWLLGSVEGLSSPWFSFLAFIIPMFSIVLSMSLSKRIIASLLMSNAYVIAYILATGHVNHEYLRNFFPLLITVNTLNSTVGHFIFYFDLITYENERQLQAQQQEIERLATHDQLTELLNRMEFNNQSEEAFEQAKRYNTDLSLAMIDLDHFKKINDTYGHPAGDEVLTRVGRLINHNARSSDIAARYGGEEFCILMPQTDLEGAKNLAERIRKRLASESFEAPDGEEFNVTCSAGVAELTEEMNSIEDLSKEADEGLYEAKDAGRDCVVCRSP